MHMPSHRVSFLFNVGLPECRTRWLCNSLLGTHKLSFDCQSALKLQRKIVKVDVAELVNCPKMGLLFMVSDVFVVPCFKVPSSTPAIFSEQYHCP